MIKKMLLVSLPVVAADQAIKAVMRRQAEGKTILELPGLIAITPSRNTGAAFSILSGQTLFLAALSAILLLGLCVYIHRSMRLTHAAETAFWFLIGGGVGNLIDRIAFSGVTDYIRLLMFDFPVFNLADIAITCSIAVLIVLLMTGRLENTTGEKHGSDH